MHQKQIVAVFFSIILLSGVTGAFSSNSAYAASDKKPIVGVWFVTSADECSDRNVEAMEHYRSVTYQFLNKYKIEHDYPVAQCVDDDILPMLVDKYSHSYDLLVIIPDIWNSLKWLISKDKGGHYFYNGQSNIIVSEAVTPYVESKSATWILSHELSHFALAWNGYPTDVVRDGVHLYQEAYDKCISEDSTGAFCPQVWTTIQTKNGKSFHVMEPIFFEDYVQQKSPTTTTPTTPTTSKTATYIEWLTPTRAADGGYKIFDLGQNVRLIGTLFSKSTDGTVNRITNVPITILDYVKYKTSEKDYIPLMARTQTNNVGEFIVEWRAIKHTGNIDPAFPDYSMWTPHAHFYGNEKYFKSSNIGNQFYVKSQPKIQPVYDSDNDGILDNVDSCKYDAETYNNYYDSDGCPDSIPVVSNPTTKSY